jgi:hypothetical protein
MNNREVAGTVCLLQSQGNRKNLFKNIVMPGRPQALTTWKKWYAMRLIIAGELDTIVEAIQELKSALGVVVCVKIVKNAMKEASLGSTEKISKLALSTRILKRG